jgi:hypothetical protein
MIGDALDLAVDVVRDEVPRRIGRAVGSASGALAEIALQVDVFHALEMETKESDDHGDRRRPC